MNIPSCKSVLYSVSDAEYKMCLNRLEMFKNELPSSEIYFRYLNGPNPTYDHNRKFFSASLKRSHVENLDFKNALFDDSSWTNSVFSNVRFVNTPFINSNASYSNFFKCTFKCNNKTDYIKGCNFSYANLIKCEFQNTSIKNSTFDNVNFENCSFTQSRITESTFEGAIFNQCKIAKVNLSNLNIDFAEFNQCTLYDVTLPFSHLPYTYGGLDFLKNTDCNITISADNFENGEISGQQYLNLLQDLITFYIYHQEYFALANIYALLEDFDKSYKALVAGIESAALSQNFRMLKFYCKLAARFDYIDYRTRQQLYEKIYNYPVLNSLTPYAAKDYYAQLGAMRRLLLFNDADKFTYEIYLKTNIDSSESNKLGLLINEFENLTRIYPKGTLSYSLELKHSCPWDVVLKFILDNQVYMQMIASSFMLTLGNVNTCIEGWDNLNRSINYLKSKCKSQKDIVNDSQNLEKQLIQSQIENESAQAKYYLAMTDCINKENIEAIDDSLYNEASIEELQKNLHQTIIEANKRLNKYNIKATLIFQNLNI